MGRGGRRQERNGPERRCIATGRSRPRQELVRFVIGPDGTLCPDVLGRLPGRGIWVSADRQALETAIRRGLFARAAAAAGAAGAAVKIPEDLPGDVERLLARRVVELVALARKAGCAVAGFERVKRWLAEGRVQVLLQAADGSARGKGKLWTPQGGRFFGMLGSAELGLAFGRESVIHGALAAGGLATRVVEDATRLVGFRGIDGGQTRREGKTTR